MVDVIRKMSSLSISTIYPELNHNDPKRSVLTQRHRKRWSRKQKHPRGSGTQNETHSKHQLPPSLSLLPPSPISSSLPLPSSPLSPSFLTCSRFVDLVNQERRTKNDTAMKVPSSRRKGEREMDRPTERNEGMF